MEKKTGDSEQICRRTSGKLKCKDVSGDNKFQYCEKHHKAYADFCRKRRLTRKRKLKKNTSGDGEGASATGGSEQICRRTFGEWKCKDVISNNQFQYCEKHYKAYADFCSKRRLTQKNKLKNTSGDREGASCSATYVGTRGSKSRKKVMDQSLDETGGVQPPTTDIQGGSANVGTKKKKLPPDEQYCCQPNGKEWRCKRKTATEEEDETGEIQPATSDNTSDTIIEGGSANISKKRKNVETTEESGERIVESESLENYKSKCFESSFKIEKMRVEYTKLKAELADVDETSKNGDATKYWKHKCSDLESLVQRLELKNSTMRCEASGVSNFESLVPRNGHENSILRCSELRNSERIIESEEWGLQDGRGNLNLQNQTENVHKRKGWVCLEEERPPQDHLEKPAFVNLVSDDEGVVDSEYSGSHGGMHRKSEDSHSHGEILRKSRDSESHGQILGKADKMKWGSDADMASSFQEDIELCMKAVCALYRLEDEILLKKLLLSDSEEKLRCTVLAKFLMDGDCKGDLKKSVKDLELFDSTAVADCKKLAKIYSPYLFYMYERGKDPFSLPATSASHGDQTAK